MVEEGSVKVSGELDSHGTPKIFREPPFEEVE